MLFTYKLNKMLAILINVHKLKKIHANLIMGVRT